MQVAVVVGCVVRAGGRDEPEEGRSEVSFAGAIQKKKKKKKMWSCEALL